MYATMFLNLQLFVLDTILLRLRKQAPVLNLAVVPSPAAALNPVVLVLVAVLIPAAERELPELAVEKTRRLVADSKSFQK